MSDKKEFVEFEGNVHLIGAASGGEFTLCGVAHDTGVSEKSPELTFKPATQRVVSCPVCVLEILNCRGVNIDYWKAREKTQ